MKQERLQIGSKVCNVYSAEQPTALLVQPMGRQEVSGMNQEVELIAKESGNVIKLEHNQFISINRNAAVELRITLEAFGHEHKQQIIDALEKNGYSPKLVRTNI